MSKEDELTEEESDVSTSEVEIPKGGGCGAGTWIIILLIIAALVAVGFWQVQRQAAIQAEKDRQMREQAREQSLGQIAADVGTVESQIQQGDVAGALATLRQMDQKLEIIQTNANTSGDSDAALEINSMRSAVGAAVREIEAKYQALQEAATQAVANVRGAFGARAPASTPPAAEEQPAAGEQPPAETPPPAGEEAPEAQAPPPAAPGEVPPEQAAPAPAAPPAAAPPAAPPAETPPAQASPTPPPA